MKSKTNDNNEIIDINPYMDAFEFFSLYKPLESEYNKIKNKSINNNDSTSFRNSLSLSKYIEEFIDKFKVDNSEIYKKNPDKVFNFFLDELHSKFKNNENEENDVLSAQINRENALNLFNNFKNKDKSFISENFFGIKSIEKSCLECKMTLYLFKYLKSIPIKISGKNEIEELDIDYHLKKMQSKFGKEEFCQICSKKTKQEIKVGIEKSPKTMIIVFLSQEFDSFKFKKNIMKNTYELIAAEIMKTKKLEEYFYFFSFCGSKKKYEFVNHKDIKKLFDNDVDRPYVLFYKKNENEKIERKVEVEDLKSKDVLINKKYNLENNNNNNQNNYITNHVNNYNNNLEYEDNNNINNNHTNNHINNHINNNYENHINNNYNNHFSNNKELISNEESSDNNNHVNNINNKSIGEEESNNNDNSIKNNNINSINDNNKITLFFKFQSNGKELYIDTNNNIPFFKIVNQLEKKYKDEFDLKIDLNKLYFNNKKIDPKKTPKEYNIPDQEYIIVDDS